MRIDESGSRRERTPFIGRTREREQLLAELERGAGLLTIAGPSGIGKTRLALQLALDLAPSSLKGGVWFCNLGACRSGADVETTVARAFGSPDIEGEDLVHAIAERGRTLLILDNVDAVSALAGELLGTWLERCVELQMLSTSIVPIGMEGEVRFELGPLDAGDAVVLYLERANRAWAGRPVHPTEPAAVEELVRRLDRNPLAIELAAARVRVLPPHALLERFDERLELLHSGGSGRHGSLLEALSLTWSLLSAQEQRVLARASVFEGGFTYEAAAAVLEEGISEIEMLDLLDGLRSKALLQIEGSQAPRFILAESVREFAGRELRKLHPAGEEVMERHARYFVERGEQEALRIEGVEELESVRWFQAERENLAAVLERNRERAPELAARAGLALFCPIQADGFPLSGIQILAVTLDAARRSGLQRLVTKAQGNYAVALAQQGRSTEALGLLDEALTLARRPADVEEEGILLLRQGSVYVKMGEIRLSIPPLERAAAIGRERALPLLEALALTELAIGGYARQELLEGEKLVEQAIAILRRHGLVRRERFALNVTGGIKSSLGYFREARSAWNGVLGRFREAGERAGEANVLLNLGSVELGAGRLQESEAYSRQSLAIHREIGNRRGAGTALGNLGAVCLERGELDLAERLLIESVELLEACGDRMIRATVLPFLAVVEARAGRPAEAQRSMEEARSILSDELNGEGALSTPDVLEGALDLARARSLEAIDPAEAESWADRARERLRLAHSQRTRRVGTMFEAIRLLEQDLADWDSTAEPSAPQEQDEGLLIGPDAGWFQVPGKERVNMRRRIALRRMLDALAERRLVSPGVGSDPYELFASGWPDQQPDTEGALRRVYVGIWTLRDLGLSDFLLHQDDGYLLDPAMPLLRQRE